VGWDWVHLVRRPLFGLLYQPRMIDECGVVGGMRIGRGNRSTRRKHAPVPLCPPQIPHDLTWDRTRAAAVGSRRLTAWAMAWPWEPKSLSQEPLTGTILCQINPVDILSWCFFKINFNTILPSTPGSSKCFHPLSFSGQIIVYISDLSPTRATYPANLVLLNLSFLIIFGEEHKLWNFSLWNS
jgi:hypothetical protein